MTDVIIEQMYIKNIEYYEEFVNEVRYNIYRAKSY